MKSNERRKESVELFSQKINLTSISTLHFVSIESVFYRSYNRSPNIDEIFQTEVQDKYKTFNNRGESGCQSL